jgi:hypothetical protein
MHLCLNTVNELSAVMSQQILDWPSTQKRNLLLGQLALYDAKDCLPHSLGIGERLKQAIRHSAVLSAQPLGLQLINGW